MTDPPDDELVAALLEESAESLYENAPCGYMTTLPNGRIVKVNATLLDWLGYARDDLVGPRYFSDLLTVGGRIYHETHFAPLLLMHGEIRGIALELKKADGTRLSVLVTSTVKTDADGQPVLVRTTLFDARERRAYEQELLRARREAEQEHERLQRLTATLQTTLLPPALPDVPGLEVAAYYHIASPDEVGGDFYDLFPLDAGSWGFFLGDVCGKGAHAAVVTSMARYTLRTAAVFHSTPAAVLDALNTALLEGQAGQVRAPFCTVAFGTITPDARAGSFSISLASGGHPPAVIMRGDGSVDYFDTVGGQLIGLLPHPHIVTISIRLDPGDTLLLYTDGVTEALVPGRGRDRLGEDAFLDFARETAPATAAETIAATRGLLATLGDGVQDDTAVLAIHVPRPPAGP